MKNSTFTALLSLGILSTPAIQAATVMVDLDLTTNGAGTDLETSPFTHTVEGVTFTPAATSNFGNNTAVFNAVSANAGVNTGGATSAAGDASSEIDPGETLTFTLGLAPNVSSVTFTSIDFGAVGDATDSATVTFPDGTGGTTTITLVDGSANFNSNDLWTPVGGIVFQDGDSITFTNISDPGESFHLQDFSFDVVTIPEPSSALLAALGTALLGCRRKR